ncbi:MAG: hypothetical protein LRY73_07260 [Bacillus sp. (in: Bacteria)]|nr:hypothetical protein [Bacillus sp. (in: firmicutes)]
MSGNYDFALYFSAAILVLGMVLLSVGGSRGTVRDLTGACHHPEFVE